MVEEKPIARVQKVLEHLYNAEVPVRPKEIAESIGDTPLNVGKDLHDLKGRSLADTEEEGQWKKTDEGRVSLEVSEPKEITETVPSQADLFKAEGQRLGIGSRKGDIRLDAIVTYVERIADLIYQLAILHRRTPSKFPIPDSELYQIRRRSLVFSELYLGLIHLANAPELPSPPSGFPPPPGFLNTWAGLHRDMIRKWSLSLTLLQRREG